MFGVLENACSTCMSERMGRRLRLRERERASEVSNVISSEEKAFVVVVALERTRIGFAPSKLVYEHYLVMVQQA